MSKEEGKDQTINDVPLERTEASPDDASWARQKLLVLVWCLFRYLSRGSTASNTE
jgi:hypothetical protein